VLADKRADISLTSILLIS